MSDLNLDLCYMTATEAVAAFKAHALSPVELLKAIIATMRAARAEGQRTHLHLFRSSAGAGQGCRVANTHAAAASRARSKA